MTKRGEDFKVDKFDFDGAGGSWESICAQIDGRLERDTRTQNDPAYRLGYTDLVRAVDLTHGRGHLGHGPDAD